MGLACRLPQAQKVVQRWKPWWQTKQAAALQLTNNGTAPLELLVCPESLVSTATTTSLHL